MQSGVMKKNIHVYLTFHHSVLQYLPLWKIKVTQNGIMKKNIHVYSTSYQCFAVFTVMENQSNTEWDYKEKQPCLFNIPSRVCITINVLELPTIMVALKLWGPALCGQCFIIRCDNNNNSMLALNSGRSRTVGMQLCLCEIWFLAALHDFELTAIHTFLDLTTAW